MKTSLPATFPVRLPALFLALFVVLFAALLLAAAPARAALRLPRQVGSHMVLQRNQPLPVWGWAAPGQVVRVAWRGQTFAAAPAAAGTGRWQVVLPPQAAGGPFGLVVWADGGPGTPADSLHLRDVLVGDVWLCAGQSNMRWPLREGVADAAAEIAAAIFPQLRVLTLEGDPAARPQPEPGPATTSWQVCSPATAGEFSAVAYFFGRRLLLDPKTDPKVPVGLVVAAVNGTRAEAWMPAAALAAAQPALAPELAALATRTQPFSADEAAYQARRAAWLASPAARDRGRPPAAKPFYEADYKAGALPVMQLPGPWEGQVPALRRYDGGLWLRRTLVLPAAACGPPATLALGQVDDEDSTWVNGQLVGHTRQWDAVRRYALPPHLLRPGPNTLAVRVQDNGQGGGLWGDPARLALEVAGQPPRPLAGPWRYLPATAPGSAPAPPFAEGPHNLPTVLWNSLVAPLLPLALTGVAWYQGESNAESPAEAAAYATLLPALINAWRRQLNRPELPFLVVQLAAYQTDAPQPANPAWAILREAQRRTVQALPHTALVVTLDVGNPTEIHPRRKRPVGERLAGAARTLVAPVSASASAPAPTPVPAPSGGPVLAGFGPAKNTVRLRFGPSGAALVLRPQPAGALPSFAVAGADRVFHWASARLEGNALVVSSPQVPWPVAVRYAWGNSLTARLFGPTGLPASPFRTDDWPLVP